MSIATSISAKGILEWTGSVAFSPTRDSALKPLFSKRRWSKTATIEGISTRSNDYAGNRVRPQANRAEVAPALEGRPQSVQGVIRLRTPEILRARDASLSKRQLAHRSHSQLLHR